MCISLYVEKLTGFLTKYDYPVMFLLKFSKHPPSHLFPYIYTNFEILNQFSI